MQLAYLWWQRRTDRVLFFWALSAWILSVGNAAFSTRHSFPLLFKDVVPTALVTVGHAALFFGARQAAGLRLHGRIVAVVVLFYVGALVAFYWVNEDSVWRGIMNGLLWSGFCFASFLSLRKATAYSKAFGSPAIIFLVQAAYHAVRMVLSPCFLAWGWTDASRVLHFGSDLEAGFFNGALFVSLLVAQVRLRDEELVTARTEVSTLSGLLPVCAWCKKIRDDKGYWNEIAEYFAKKGGPQVTHGICSACADKMATPPGRPIGA